MKGRPCSFKAGVVLALAVAMLLVTAAPSGASTLTLGKGSATITAVKAAWDYFTYFGPVYNFASAPASMTCADPTVATLQLRMPVTGGSWNASAHKGTFKLAGGYFWESGNSSALYATDHWRAGLGTPQGWAVSHLGTVVANFFLTDQISVKLTNHRKTIHVTLDLFYNDTGGTALTAAGINLPPNLIGMLFGHVSLVAKVK